MEHVWIAFLILALLCLFACLWLKDHPSGWVSWDESEDPLAPRGEMKGFEFNRDLDMTEADYDEFFAR